MRSVDFVPVLLTEKADVFSIRLGDSVVSMFQSFYIRFKDSQDPYVTDDLNRILATIKTIGQKGVLENEMRPESHMNDRVCAIPLTILPRDKKKHGTLRLYCIRVSDKLFVLGGGGLKRVQTYEDDENLSKQVDLLQKIDQAFRDLEEQGVDIHREIYNLTLQID